MQIYKVKNNQNIFDVALNIYGSIEGVFNLLANNPELSFSSILKEDDELYWDEGSAIYDHNFVSIRRWKYGCRLG